jgi:hypothetical protein
MKIAVTANRVMVVLSTGICGQKPALFTLAPGL